MGRVFGGALILLMSGLAFTQGELGAAVELWERALAAKGGRERLHTIFSVVRSSRIPSKLGRLSFDREVEELFVFPDLYWRWTDERPTTLGISAVGLNFKTGKRFFMWETDKMPRQSLADRGVEGYKLDVMEAVELLETRWIKLSPVRSWSEKKGKLTSLRLEGRFQTTPGWATVTFTLDEKTLLPLRASVLRPFSGTASAGREEFELLNYVDINGIKMPTLIRRSGPIEYEEKLEYQFNVQHDPAVFEVGPRFEAGPKGWQKR